MRYRQAMILPFAFRTVCCTCYMALAVAVGCQGVGDTVVVKGSVSYAGKKVTNGDIRFYPVEGSEGPTSGASIVDGSYKVVSKGGVPIGTHRVVIRAFSLEDIGAVSGQAQSGGDLLSGSAPVGPKKLPLPVYLVEGREQFLPGKYNVQSGLTATISGEEDPQIVDFDLPKIE